MSEQTQRIEPDLGVPMARNALIYSAIGLAITAIVGLFLWDLLGLVFGIPLAVIGLVRGALAVPRTGPYPRDRAKAITAIVAGFAALALVWPIIAGAMSTS